MKETTISHDVLPEGYLLLWYVIKSVLGQGGFGVTYLAVDTNLDRLVAIKEYMPIEFSIRDAKSTVHPRTGQMSDIFQWGLKRFLSEGKTLARFKHPNIIRVHSVFEHNNTAYMVMEYEQGEDLAGLFERGLYRSEEELMNITLPILDGLSRVHQADFIHRDIKPANICIREDSSPVLLDFGSARQALSGEAQAMTTLVTRGYTPFEQYNDAKGEQGPCSDIYAMGATLYMGITGKPPVDALVRGAAVLNNQEDPLEPLSKVAAGRYSEGFLNAVDEALRFHLEDRPQNVESWRELLPRGRERPSDDKTRIQPRAPAQSTAVPLDRTVIQQGVRASASDIQSHRRTAEEIPASQGRTKTKRVGFSPHKLTAILLLMASAALVIVGAIYLNRDRDENEVDGITQMLDQADLAFAASRLTSPEGNNALEGYQHVLEQEPGNAKAKQGIDNILLYYLQLIERGFERNQLNQASENLTIAERIQPGNQSVAQFRLELEEKLKAGEKSSLITQFLEAAKFAFEQGHVVVPFGESALDKYRAVVELDPDNSTALQGISEVTDHLARRVERSLNEGDLASAKASMQSTEKLSLRSTKLDQLRERLTTSHRENIKQQSITRLLKKAEETYKLNQWTYPLGNNAVEYYNEVLRLDPGNRNALRGLGNIMSYFLRRMDEKIKTGNLQSAESSLKKAESVQPENPRVVEARTRWVQAKKILESASISPPKVSPSPPEVPPEPMVVVPTRPDIEIVSELFASFKKALEQHDMSKLQSVTNLSSQKLGLIEQVFNQYQTIQVSITELMIVGQKGEASAFVTFKKLIVQNGDSVIPGRSWRRTRIVANKEGGRWTKLNW